MLTRRSALASLAVVTVAGAGAAYGIRKWSRRRQDLAITADDGQPVLNRVLPEGAAKRLAGLPEITFVGAAEPALTLYEFSDFNCPECHVAAADIATLLAGDRGVRVGLVNNPIVSAPSAQAAAVMLAVQLQAGPEAAYDLYRRLFGLRSRIDGRKALEQALAIGVPRDVLERLIGGDEVRQALGRQMQEARDLGLFATPSYVIGDVGLIGHPGPNTLAGMIGSLRSCDRVACG